MLPKFVDAPDTLTLKLLFLMFTLDILYSLHSLSFALRTAKAAAKVRNGVYRHHIHRDFFHWDIIRSILRLCVNANAKSVSRNWL